VFSRLPKSMTLWPLLVAAGAFQSQHVSKISGGEIIAVSMIDLRDAVDDVGGSSLAMAADAGGSGQIGVGSGTAVESHRLTVLGIVHGVAIGAGAGDHGAACSGESPENSDAQKGDEEIFQSASSHDLPQTGETLSAGEWAIQGLIWWKCPFPWPDNSPVARYHTRNNSAAGSCTDGNMPVRAPFLLPAAAKDCETGPVLKPLSIHCASIECSPVFSRCLQGGAVRPQEGCCDCRKAENMLWSQDLK